MSAADECIAPDACRDDGSLCGGYPGACRLHDPCTCDPADSDPDCRVHADTEPRDQATYHVETP